MHLSRIVYRSSLQAPACRSLPSMIPLNESEYGLALSSDEPIRKASDGNPRHRRLSLCAKIDSFGVLRS